MQVANKTSVRLIIFIIPKAAKNGIRITYATEGATEKTGLQTLIMIK